MRILICVGGMPYSELTLNFGNLIANLGRSHITLLTIIDKMDQQKAAESLLLEARNLLDFPVDAQKIRRGNIVDQIMQETREGDYDMIIVGENARHGPIDLLLQPIPHRIAVKSFTSVLVVKRFDLQLDKILICTSGHPLNRSVVESGARLAQESGARVRLLYVALPVPSMYSGMRTMEESLTTLLDSGTPVSEHLRWGANLFETYGVMADLALRHGIAADEIINEATEGNYDLIVIGAKPKDDSIRQLLMTQVMPDVVDQAPCSVLIVRQDIFQDEASEDLTGA